MRRVEYKKSFDRSFRQLETSDQKKVFDTISRFLKSIETNQLPSGLGLKRLKKDLWEIRVDLNLRICFFIKKDRIEFGLTGDHNTVKRYLKQINPFLSPLRYQA